jgi:hypothetical protein
MPNSFCHYGVRRFIAALSDTKSKAAMNRRTPKLDRSIFFIGSNRQNRAFHSFW